MGKNREAVPKNPPKISGGADAWALELQAGGDAALPKPPKKTTKGPPKVIRFPSL